LEVIVVDDGSTDGTAGLVAGLGLAGVRVIRQENAGKAAALCTGVAAARHGLLVLIDGDTIVEPETLGLLVQPFRDPRVGAVAGTAKVANRTGVLCRWQHADLDHRAVAAAARGAAGGGGVRVPARPGAG
jgi:cellulose synthase/poly-beta-1,6-N-acetylglucosamine synthase-like glycosyltransferase